MQPEFDSTQLTDLVKVKMPFGKYKNTLLCDIPVSYLEWMAKTGFPKSKLGNMLQTLLVIKSNGLEEVLTNLKNMA